MNNKAKQEGSMRESYDFGSDLPNLPSNVKELILENTLKLLRIQNENKGGYSDYMKEFEKLPLNEKQVIVKKIKQLLKIQNQGKAENLETQKQGNE